MTTQHLDNVTSGAILKPPQPVLVELRGPSGRLYGRLDLINLVIEVKKGEQVERIDLKQYLGKSKV